VRASGNKIRVRLLYRLEHLGDSTRELKVELILRMRSKIFSSPIHGDVGLLRKQQTSD